MPTETDSATGPSGPLALFVSFNRMAMQAFGGVLPVARHELVQRRRWLDDAQFVEMLGLAQVLPGGNVLNLALMVGDRQCGWRGALAALAGLLSLPLILVIGLAALHGAWAEHAQVAGAVRGMGAVAAGLVVAMAVKLTPTLRGNPLGPLRCLALALATFAAIALLRWPLVAVIAGLGLLAFALAWRALRR